MFDWESLDVHQMKSGVCSVSLPGELLDLARRETDCEDLSGECLDRVRDWLLEQLSEHLRLPVIRKAELAFLKSNADGARLIFLTR